MRQKTYFTIQAVKNVRCTAEYHLRDSGRQNRAQIDTLRELLKALKLKIFLLPEEEMKQMPSREQDYVLTGLSNEKKEVVMQLIRWLADL